VRQLSFDALALCVVHAAISHRVSNGTRYVANLSRETRNVRQRRESGAAPRIEQISLSAHNRGAERGHAPSEHEYVTQRNRRIVLRAGPVANALATHTNRDGGL
jgi:hypothetical protein